MPKLLFFLILFLFHPPASRAEDTSLLSQIQKIQSSLVEVKTVYSRALTTKSGRYGIASYERHGAGIIIDPSGIIVTNTHIVAFAPHIYVTISNGQQLEATLLFESEADFSFIKIDPPVPLKPIRWAESSQAQLGQSVIAIGNSEFDDKSILGGEISSLIVSKTTGAIELIELNINLYKGDSGGPILDNQGRLLGLIMGKENHEDRKSFAIASDKIRQEYLKIK